MAFSFGSTSTPSTNTFGGTSTAPTTGFSFGTQSSAPSTGFGTQSSAPSTGFSFGATSSAANTGFGAASTAPTTGFGAPTTGLSFGTSIAPTTGFGASSTGFGTSAAGATSGFSFGSNTQSFGGSLFGANKGSTIGSFGQNSEQQKKQREQQVFQLLCEINKETEISTVRKVYEAKNVWQALALLKSYYDPKSPHCRFRHYFYNLVSPQEVHLYQKPADHDLEEWKAAQRDNPDKTKFVPALAIGFDDVQKRMDQQHRLSEAHDSKLKELETILKNIQQTRLVDTATKLNECKRKHMETAQRLIKFLKYVQVMRSKGLSTTAEEEAMRINLVNIQQQLQTSELFHGKLNQLWAQLQLLQESGRKYGNLDHVEWHAVSEEHFNEIRKNLNEQSKGIQHVVEVIHKDTSGFI